LGTTIETVQITNRSIQGKPVLPMMMRKVMSNIGKIAYWNDNMLSGVRVKPRSLNAEADVKIPLEKD